MVAVFCLEELAGSGKVEGIRGEEGKSKADLGCLERRISPAPGSVRVCLMAMGNAVGKTHLILYKFFFEEQYIFSFSRFT